MTNNILGCYITGLYMTFNQWQFLLSTSPFCCVRHASLQTWLLILSGQKSTGDGLTTHGWPPSGSILSHKLQSLSGAPNSPPHNNKSHPQLIFWPVCCWRIAGRAFSVRYTPLVYRRWWSIPYYYGKAAQTSPFPATMKWGSYSDTVRCHSSGVW